MTPENAPSDGGPQRLNPAAMSPADAARVLMRVGGSPVTEDMLLADIDAGAPTNAVLWGLYGNAWYSLGNWGKAATAYETALVLDPDEPIYSMNAARAFERSGRCDAAPCPP